MCDVVQSTTDQPQSSKDKCGLGRDHPSRPTESYREPTMVEESLIHLKILNSASANFDSANEMRTVGRDI